jgi:hypothetical protein
MFGSKTRYQGRAPRLRQCKEEVAEFSPTVVDDGERAERLRMDLHSFVGLTLRRGKKNGGALQV